MSTHDLDLATSPEVDELDLIGSMFPSYASNESESDPESAEPRTEITELSPRVEPQKAQFTWLHAITLVPEYEPTIRRYPPIGVQRHPELGRVITAVYLEDSSQKIRRNFQLGESQFLAAQALRTIEPDTRKLNCRVIIKLIPYKLGMKIRFWENRAGGDVLSSHGVIEVIDAGLQVRMTRVKK